MFRVGQRLGARPDAQLWGVTLNRFHYQRLGPDPEFSVTILVGEGGADPVWVDVLCDSDSIGCGGHQIDARTSPPVETPLGAATEVHAATEWLRRRIADESESSLRRHDPNSGHPPAPRRHD